MEIVEHKPGPDGQHLLEPHERTGAVGHQRHPGVYWDVRSGDETPELIRQHRTAGVRSRKHPNFAVMLGRTRQYLEVPWAPLPDPPGIAAIECQTDRLGVGRFPWSGRCRSNGLGVQSGPRAYHRVAHGDVSEASIGR